MISITNLRSLLGVIFATTLVGVAPDGLPILLNGATAQEPPVVQVGDGTVDGSFIEPYIANWRITRLSPDGVASAYGSWTDTVRYVTQGGRHTMQRIVARFDSTGARDLWRDHLVVPGSLAPIVTHQRALVGGVEQSVRIEFIGDSIHIDASAGNQRQQLGRRYDHAVFDLSLYAVLLLGFPLQVGYTAQFPTYGQTLEPMMETLRVTGVERVDLEAGQSVEAFVVSTEQRTWTAWLSRAAPYIVRIVQRLDDGTQLISERVSISTRR